MSAPAPAPRRLAAAGPSTSAIFLVLRRMQAPLIVLILMYTISIFGLTLMPGVDQDGNPWRMDAFDAFYFMSYTATTIGYGEIPHPFTPQQRMWVVLSIYLSVIGWAYAIGSILSLLRDPGFREALALQRFERKVRGLREDFFILAGFGQAGEEVARQLDRTAHRLVVLDADAARVDAANLASFQFDVPVLQADASNPYELKHAGLDSPHCAGVLALTDDEQVNVAVSMAALLQNLPRPDAAARRPLQAVCSTLSDATERRLRTIGEAMIIDPFNLYGDELVVAMRAPSTHRLLTWLTRGCGTQIPDDTSLPRQGRWIVAGYGRFGSHLVNDLLAHGVPVTVIDPKDGIPAQAHHIQRDAEGPDALDGVDFDDAVAFVAATGLDVANLALLVEAQRHKPEIYTIGRENDPANRPLFDGIGAGSLFIPSKLIADEVLARVSDPMMWRFVQEAKKRGDDWGAPLLSRVAAFGTHRLADLWTEHINSDASPALIETVRAGEVTVGDLLRDPQDRETALDVVVLMIERAGEVIMSPADDEVLSDGDRLMMVGKPYSRRALSLTASVPSAAQYVLSGQRVANTWIGRAPSG